MAVNDYLIKKRITKTRTVGWLLTRLPFVRCVILNGSLAYGNHSKSSDIDILIIAKDGRIFTARFFINLFAIALGIKRSKDESKDHSGKFCFNYFLTEGFLKIPTGRGEKIDEYCAQNYSKSIFLAGDHNLYEMFIKTNNELFYRYNCHPEVITEGSSSQKERVVASRFIARLRLSIGDWLERVLKTYQIKKIELDPRTKKYPHLIAYNDRELRFHPPKIR